MTSATPRVDDDTATRPPTAADTLPTPAGDGPPPPRPTTWGALRPLLHRLHFYAGILVGPFLLVAALTGLMYTAMPTVDSLLHRQELRVDEVGTRTFALDEQLAAARAAHPEGTVSQVRPAATADATTWVVLAVDDVPEGFNRTVFVDPYTLEVRGAETMSGDAFGTRAWVSELHSSLHLGEAGRLYSELAASWLWVVVLGGLAMWVARVARTRSARRLVVPEVRAKSARKRVLSWHGAVGTVVAAGLLGIAVTGLTWSEHAGANIGEMRTALSWTTPQVDATLPDAQAPESDGGGHGHHHGPSAGPSSDDVLTAGVGINGVLAVARAEGLVDPLQVTPPAEDWQAWTVKETTSSWPVESDTIAVDGSTGAVVDRLDFADYPLGAKLTKWGIAAHMGLLFGIWNQIALAAVALGLVALVVLGYRMWWQRRPTRSVGRGPGPVVGRGALRRAPLWLSITVLALAAAVGWFLPLFGIPLAAFLLVDLLLAARARRTSRVRA
ncbi:PepSY-associated TM helix domain-containing protein [Cellulosimicrobium marinum]|uniref:PepSY-associated TM helix domain-containing protein n=1 Tax=Cellulosimicrobium marinum TaxID=1638992 RepID=UPI001E2AB798|nr:PepSY domain-containing protein [Cellulosimicrobium marinum]MCB7135604.1 PepSY domain-containing protein [Cellulosimicrobium marinum]